LWIENRGEKKFSWWYEADCFITQAIKREVGSARIVIKEKIGGRSAGKQRKHQSLARKSAEPE